MVAARAKPLFEVEARARQGTRTDLLVNLQKSEPVHVHVEAAQLVNVSPRSVESASKVLREGTPELVHAVESGEVSVSAASAVVELPKGEQQEVVARGEKEILRVSREIRQRKAQTTKGFSVVTPLSLPCVSLGIVCRDTACLQEDCPFSQHREGSVLVFSTVRNPPQPCRSAKPPFFHRKHLRLCWPALCSLSALRWMLHHSDAAARLLLV